MGNTMRHFWTTPLLLGALLLLSSAAQADIVTDWNITAGDIVLAARMLPPPSNRVMAMVQSAVYEAVNAITKRYPPDRVRLEPSPGASVEAAVAAVNCATLSKLIPSQQGAIDDAYQKAMSAIPDGPPKTEGIAVARPWERRSVSSLR